MSIKMRQEVEQKIVGKFTEGRIMKSLSGKMKFKPSNTMIGAVEALLMAKAHVELTRERVVPIQKAMLALVKAVDKETGKPITEAKDGYRMSDEQFKDYLTEVHHEYIKEGFNVKQDYCPLLIAEDLERQAKHALILAMNAQKEFESVTVNGLLCLGIAKYEQFIDLCIKLIVPFVKKERMLLVEGWL